jgi:hypothetical protein
MRRDHHPIVPVPPAIVQACDNRAELAVQIKAEIEARERFTRKGLEHFRKAGELLLQVKSQCRHGEWLPWLREHGIKQPTYWRYATLAKRWDKDKLFTVNNLVEALRILTRDPKPRQLPLFVVLKAVEPGLSQRDVVEQSSCFVFKNGYVYTYNTEVFCRHPYRVNFEGAVSRDLLASPEEEDPGYDEYLESHPVDP